MTALLLLIVAGLPGDLPGHGYVDVAQLVRSHPRYERLAHLREAARRLRETTLPGPAPVPSVAPAPTGEGTPGEAPPTDEVGAVQAELDILRAAMIEETESNRQRRLDSQSTDLLLRLESERGAARFDWSDWERSVAAEQVLPHATQVMWQTFTGPISPAAQAALQREAQRVAAQAAVAAALATQRWTELQVETTRRDRQRVALLFAQLDRTARDERRQAERSLAGRETELYDEAARREKYRGEHFGQAAAAQVELALADWERTLAARGGTAAERRDRQHGRFALAAEALDQQAAAAEAELLVSLRRRVTALLPTLGRELGILLTTDPTAGWPDVTTQVAQRLAALESGFAGAPPAAP